MILIEFMVLLYHFGLLLCCDLINYFFVESVLDDEMFMTLFRNVTSLQENFEEEVKPHKGNSLSHILFH